MSAYENKINLVYVFFLIFQHTNVFGGPLLWLEWLDHSWSVYHLQKPRNTKQIRYYILFVVLKSRIINSETADVMSGMFAVYNLLPIHEFAEARDKIEWWIMLMYRYINAYTVVIKTILLYSKDRYVFPAASRLQTQHGKCTFRQKKKLKSCHTKTFQTNNNIINNISDIIQY